MCSFFSSFMLFLFKKGMLLLTPISGPAFNCCPRVYKSSPSGSNFHAGPEMGARSISHFHFLKIVFNAFELYQSYYLGPLTSFVFKSQRQRLTDTGHQNRHGLRQAVCLRRPRGQGGRPGLRQRLQDGLSV